MVRSALWRGILGSIVLTPALAVAQTPPPAPPPAAVLFENVRVFDGTSERLSPPRNVLVLGNKIQAIAEAPIAPPAGAALTRIARVGAALGLSYQDQQVVQHRITKILAGSDTAPG
jgi:hypothetical protein